MKTLLILLLTSCLAMAGALDERPVEKQSINGYVVQRLRDGCLVSSAKAYRLGSKEVEGVVFVSGLKLYNDAPVRVRAIPDGDYEYTTVTGAIAIIPAFRLP